MKDVFISYRRELGEVYARKLYEYLSNKSRGLRVWFDKVDMEDGKPFPVQLETAVRNTPNYVLIATQNVFSHGKEERDWVWKEIETALDEYKKNPFERTLTVLVPHGVEIPTWESLPKEIRDIADVQRIGERTDTISLSFEHDWSKEFHRVFIAVTELNRRNLWYAAHRWYKNSREKGGRFSSLCIDETIMPGTLKKHTRKELPICVFPENQNDKSIPLLEALSSTNGHLYLIGQGGIGKTTALMYIMKQAYDEKSYKDNTQIPIFVELSHAPDSASGQIYANGKSTFIRRSIFRQVRAERSFQIMGDSEVETLTDLFGLPYDFAVRPIVDLLRHNSPAPEYLLLLDGLNEVSTQTIEAELNDGGKTKATVYEMIRGEILWIIENCPNVRIILTSRSDESLISESITKLYLSEIEKSAVFEYLKKSEIDGAKIEESEIDRINNDTELMEILRVPLFLTIYVSLHDRSEVTAAGEILRVFFNERRHELPDHTIKDHLTAIEKNVISNSAGFLVGRITSDIYDFILDFILPEVAWNIERNGKFLFSARTLRKVIIPILKDRTDLSICGDFGKEAFTEYLSSDTKTNTYATAKKLLALSDDESEIIELILDICVNVLGILHSSENKYGFVHQHIRDYFAAVKIVNAMRLSLYLFEEGEKELSLECINRAFQDEPVSLSVRRFIGEYLCEHKNKPYFNDGKWNYGVPSHKCNRSLLSNLLNIYRNLYEDKNNDSLLSIISIIKETRKDLTGEALNNLNLTKIDLSKHIIGRNTVETNLTGSLISKYTLFGFSFSDNIKDVLLSPDDKYLLVFDERQFVYQLELKTLCLISKTPLPFNVVSISMTDESDAIRISSRDGRENAFIHINKMNLEITFPEEATNERIFHNRKYVLENNDNHVNVVENNKFIALYLYSDDYHFADVDEFNEKSQKLIDDSFVYVITVFSLESGNPVLSLKDVCDVLFFSDYKLIAYSNNIAFFYDMSQGNKLIQCIKYEDIIRKIISSEHYLFVFLCNSFIAYDTESLTVIIILDNLDDDYSYKMVSEQYLLIQNFIVDLKRKTFFTIEVEGFPYDLEFDLILGKWLIFSSQKLDNSFLAYDIDNNRAKTIFLPRHPFIGVSLIDNENNLFYYYFDKESVVKRYSLNDFKVVDEFRVRSNISFIKKISHNLIVIVYTDNSFDIVDSKNSSRKYQLYSYSQNNNLTSTIDILDGKFIACITKSGYFEIRDFNSLDLKGAIISIDEHFVSIKLLKSKGQIIVSNNKHQIRVYDASNLRELYSYNFTQNIKNILVSSDEKIIYLIGDSEIGMFDSMNRTIIGSIDINDIEDNKTITRARISSDDKNLYLVLESKKLDSGGSSLSVHSSKMARINLKNDEITIGNKMALTIADFVLTETDDILAVLLDGSVYIIDSNDLSKKNCIHNGSGISGLKGNKYIDLIDDKIAVYENSRLFFFDGETYTELKRTDKYLGQKIIQSNTGFMLLIDETSLQLMKKDLIVSRPYGVLNNCFVNTKMSKNYLQNDLNGDIHLLQQYGAIID